MSRYLSKSAVVAAAFLVSATPGFAQTTISPAAKELASLANRDKELTVMWSSATIGGQRGAKVFETAINKMFGIDIKINWVPGESMPTVGNQVASAAQNGLPSPTDVYIAAARTMAILHDRNLFYSAPWGSYVPDRLTGGIVELDTYVKVFSLLPGFSYNSALAPSKPEKLEDFLKPEWKGKFATTSVAAIFDLVAAKESWGPAKTLEFSKKFSDAAAGFMRCNEMPRLATGEFLALVPDCGGENTREFAASRGAPLARVASPDVPLITYFYLAVPKNAKSANLAKLFVAFALTKEGQQVVREQMFGDLHLFPESIVKQELANAEKAAGKKFVDADIAWQKTNAEGNATQQEIQKIFAAGSRR